MIALIEGTQKLEAFSNQPTQLLCFLINLRYGLLLSVIEIVAAPKYTPHDVVDGGELEERTDFKARPPLCADGLEELGGFKLATWL